LNSLDDLKLAFVEKKRVQQAEKEGRDINSSFYPYISDSEMNTMDAFIDFLKGLLRMDKE
jgi:hypothetical protein